MDLFKCVAVVFLIDSVSCIKDVNLNNLKLETVSKLLNILTKYDSNIKYIYVRSNVKEGQSRNKNDIDILNDFEIDKKFVHQKNYKKKTWIKTLIPHGLPPSNLEFDAKYKTVYKPLIRIHKRKPLPNIQVMLNVNGNEDGGVDKYGIDVHDYFDDDENVINFVKKNEPETMKNVKQVKNIDEDLLQPFAYHPIKSNTLKEVEQILKRFRSRTARPETINKIVNILNELKDLRTFEKSGEVNDPTAPGKHYHVEDSVQKPKKPLQHYPPWNYWTYKKTIHQDQCPKGQVRINDRCIWLPPH